MEIVCTADFHGDTSNFDRLKGEKADLLVIAGDLTDLGGQGDAGKMIELLEGTAPRTMAVQGNCDRAGVLRYLIDNDLSLHSSAKVENGVGFFGLGGSNTTPFNTPTEFSEDEIWSFLNIGYGLIEDREKKVMVSHAPPYGTKVDMTGSGLNVGSRSVRKFIESYRPDLVICGHIHEARGHDRVGDTVVINTGPLYRGFVRVKIDGKPEFEFVDL
jgi:uncharacterized protein